MKINTIIIDDEPFAIKVIQKHLEKFKNFNIVSTFNNPIDAIDIIESENIDVIFLDINMPKMNGIEFIKNITLKSHVVITTAYREFAIDAYELDALDYLVKPIPFNRFLKTVNKLTQRISNTNYNSSQKNDAYIFLKVDKKLVKVKYQDILYIESLKDYIKVSTTTDNYIVHKSLTSISEELPNDLFLRIHRSYTISIDKINYVEGNSLTINNKRIPIGRKYLSNTKQIILNANNDS